LSIISLKNQLTCLKDVLNIKFKEINMRLLSKEFLEELYKCCESFTIVDYIMQSKKVSFHDAVLELAQHCELKKSILIYVRAIGLGRGSIGFVLAMKKLMSI